MIARRMRGVAADADAGHQDGLLDVAEAVHAHVRAEDAADDAAAGDDAAGRDDRVERLAAPPAFLGEHELRRRRLRLIGAERPFRIVEVELRIDLAEVHAGFEVRVERADVAPVLRRPSCSRRRTGTSTPAPSWISDGMMFLPKSCWLSADRRIVFERAHEHVGSEDVDAHRRQRDVAAAGHRRGRAGFSSKSITRSGSSMLTMPKRLAVADRHLDASPASRPRSVPMEPQHLRVVHLVDVVARQDDDVARRFAGDRVEVLEDGIGGAEIPVLADALLWRQDLDELAQLFGNDVPAHPDVAVEGERLVLRGDEDAAQPGVDAVAEREIDDPVRSAEIDGWFGPLFGQREETFSGAAGEEDDKDVVQLHDLVACRE